MGIVIFIMRKTLSHLASQFERKISSTINFIKTSFVSFFEHSLS
ncbi:MAG: hypothetical protein ACI83B_003726, partial [Sediminicola sp.]